MAGPAEDIDLMSGQFAGGPPQPRVAVLLSTYNGERFLKPQLDSLTAQQGVDVQVFVRDDGSTDRTLRILAETMAVWPQLAQPITGDPLGPAKSYLTLMAAAPDGFDYYAFCDQDDVWASDKLARAASVLATHADSGPGLYCGRVTYVDDKLMPLGDSAVDPDHRFEHLLFENIAFGNTVVMNGAARRLIASVPLPDDVIMHDWWCALVVSAFGEILYDEAPRILYRQHTANVVGASASRIGEVLRHGRVFLSDPGRLYPIHGQAKAFMRLYGERLPSSRKAMVEALVASRESLMARLRYAARGPLVRRRRLDALAARLLVAAGCY
jgi:glycosyltransferase involved in cell wall biosynthesis